MHHFHWWQSHATRLSYQRHAAAMRISQCTRVCVCSGQIMITSSLKAATVEQVKRGYSERAANANDLASIL